MTDIACDVLMLDLDGVLIDSVACVERQWRWWAQRHGLDAAAILAIAHGRRTVETIRLIAPELAADREAELLAIREERDLEGVAVIPGAPELLAALPPESWAIVTSGTRAVATNRLRHVGLPRPEILISAEDVHRGKPDPEGYRTAAVRLGADPERCLVLEDAPAGIEAARAAGARVLAVPTTHDLGALAGADYRAPALSAIRVMRFARGTSPRLLVHIPDRA